MTTTLTCPRLLTLNFNLKKRSPIKTISKNNRNIYIVCKVIGLYPNLLPKTLITGTEIRYITPIIKNGVMHVL